MHSSVTVLTLIHYGGNCFSVRLPLKVMLQLTVLRNNEPQHITMFPDVIMNTLGICLCVVAGNQWNMSLFS